LARHPPRSRRVQPRARSTRGIPTPSPQSIRNEWWLTPRPARLRPAARPARPRSAAGREPASFGDNNYHARTQGNGTGRGQHWCREATAASTAHACSAALGAVSDYGPAIVKDAIAGHETLAKIEIDLIVTVLKGAAAATGNPAAKQSIVSLAGDYLELKDSLHGKVDAAVEQQVDVGAAHLKEQCKSS
jgi:hypothetical protein